MNRLFFLLTFLVLAFPVFAEEKDQRLTELDSFWDKVSLAVKEGDFESYSETCHPEAVLVSGTKETSYPLAQALVRWKEEFDNTRAGKVKANVEFRFGHRYGDESTAHESGMFLYTSQHPGEDPKREFIHFEGLLIKKEGQWLMLMEYQKSRGTEAEWEALKQ